MEIVKKVIIIISVLLSVLLIVSIIYLEKNCSTMENYLNGFFSNVTIHKIDYNTNLILFSEGDEKENKQYILGKFRKLNGYYFDLHDEVGRTYGGQYLLLVSYRKDIGNVVWGTFNIHDKWGTSDINDKIKKIELEYKNMKTKNKYFQQININNNAYFAYLPSELINENFFNGKWRYTIRAYNELGKLSLEYKNMTLPYDRNLDINK